MHRCRVSPDELRRERIRLSPDASHHLAHVLRIEAGARIQLFDGRGGLASAQVEAVSPEGVDVRVTERGHEAAAANGPRVVLLQALPKGRLMEWIVEKATEIGVAAVVPVVAQRSVRRPDAERAESRVERWRKIAEAATRQCGAATVPDVLRPCPLGEALDAAGPLDLLLVCCVAAGAEPLGRVLAARLPATRAVGIMVGPEGDWSPEEVSEGVRRGGIAVSFGPRVLRVETASLYAVSAVAYAAGR